MFGRGAAKPPRNARMVGRDAMLQPERIYGLGLEPTLA